MKRPDVIHVSSPGVLVFAGILYAKLLDLPLVVSYHTHVPGAMTLPPCLRASFCVTMTSAFCLLTFLLPAKGNVVLRCLPDQYLSHLLDLGLSGCRLHTSLQIVEGLDHSNVAHHSLLHLDIRCHTCYLSGHAGEFNSQILSMYSAVQCSANSQYPVCRCCIQPGGMDVLKWQHCRRQNGVEVSAAATARASAAA